MTDPYTELQDPSTSAQRLSELAAAHPELGPWIAAHPNAYPELQQWIATYAQPAPAAPAAPAAGDPYTAAAQPAPPTDPFDRPDAGSSPFGAGPAAYGPTASETGPSAPEAARKSRKGLVIGLSVGVVVALVLAGGGVWWFFASRLGGAASPEAAFSKLVSGVEGLDPLTLYGSFAPSEVGTLKDSIQKLVDAKPKDADHGADLQKTLDQIRSNVHITSTDMTYTTDMLADTVARVTWTGGEITIDGDAAKIAEAVVRAYEPAMRAMYERSGATSSEIENQLADQKTSIADALDLPRTLTPQAITGDNGVAALVMVDEGTGWYVSPMLSAADAAYLRMRESSELGPLGTRIVSATTYATPEDAASGLAKATLSGDIDQVAASLPLAERRLLSIYGEALPAGMRDWYRGAVRNVKLTDSSFSSTIDGDRARVSIGKLGISTSVPNDEVGNDLVSSWSVSGVCADWSYQYAYDDGSWVSGRYSWQSGSWVSDWVVKTSEGSYCLDDDPVSKKLGAGDSALVAVKENGGWLVSPTATLGDIYSTEVTNLLPYYENGTLDELIR